MEGLAPTVLNELVLGYLEKVRLRLKLSYQHDSKGGNVALHMKDDFVIFKYETAASSI